MSFVDHQEFTMDLLSTDDCVHDSSVSQEDLGLECSSSSSVVLTEVVSLAVSLDALRDRVRSLTRSHVALDSVCNSAVVVVHALEHLDWELVLEVSPVLILKSLVGDHEIAVLCEHRFENANTGFSSARWKLSYDVLLVCVFYCVQELLLFRTDSFIRKFDVHVQNILKTF